MACFKRLDASVGLSLDSPEPLTCFEFQDLALGAVELGHPPQRLFPRDGASEAAAMAVGMTSSFQTVTVVVRIYGALFA